MNFIILTDRLGNILPLEYDYWKDAIIKRDKITRKAACCRKNVVIMGRKTWDLMERPLRGRINIILTKNTSFKSRDSIDPVFGVNSVLSCLKKLAQLQNVDSIFVIGGLSMFKLFTQYVKTVYWISTSSSTYVDIEIGKFNINDFGSFPLLLNEERNESYSVSTFSFSASSKKHEEYQYLNLIQHIRKNGIKRDDRTGVGTLSIFSPDMLRFSLKNGKIPLITTKFVPWKIVVDELLWFMQGHTDTKILSQKGIHIWDGNSSREFLDKQGFIDYDTGIIGPGYGWQWRFSGANYKKEYSNVDLINDDELLQIRENSVDQLNELINGIIKDPLSRRHILCAWNSADIKKMALPPCHVLAQFYVTEEREISCHLYIRSSDVFLGLPFNIASYAILTFIIAKYTQTKPLELCITIGDAHLYLDHIKQTDILLRNRIPYEFPNIDVDITNENRDFKDINVQITNYIYHKKINAKMAV